MGKTALSCRGAVLRWSAHRSPPLSLSPLLLMMSPSLTTPPRSEGGYCDAEVISHAFTTPPPPPMSPPVSQQMRIPAALAARDGCTSECPALPNDDPTHFSHSHAPKDQKRAHRQSKRGSLRPKLVGKFLYSERRPASVYDKLNQEPLSSGKSRLKAVKFKSNHGWM